MDKLELDLDDLEVDSFRTDPEQEDERGTVQGNDHSCHSCDVTCDGTTCDGTCDDTCGDICSPLTNGNLTCGGAWGGCGGTADGGLICVTGPGDERC